MKRFTVLLGVLAACAGAAEWPLGGAAAHYAPDVAWTLAGAFAVVALRTACGSTDVRERRVWRSLMFAAGAWLAGQLVWDIYDVAKLVVPSPSAADLFWLAFPVAAAVGVYRFAPAPVHVRRILDFDAIAIAIGAGALTVAYNWDELAISQLPLTGRLTTFAYPVTYSIVCALGAGALIGAPEIARRRDLLLVLSGIAVEGLAFLLWCPQVLSGTFAQGSSLLDPLWTLGLLLMGAGALVARTEAPHLVASAHRLRRRTILPAGMLIALVVTQFWLTASDAELAPRLTVLGSVAVLGVVLLVRNWFAFGAVEQLEAAERATLARRNRELEAFAYGASHDLKAPLVSIGGFAELLERHLGDQADERTAFFVTRIRANTDSLQTMIADLFAFARSGVDDSAVDPIDPTELAEEIAAEWRERAEHAGMPLVVDGPLPLVRAHPVRFKQALTNLVDNALRYGSGHVRVFGTARGDLAEIAVEDGGLGVPPAERDQIFEVFARGESARALAPDGTGLGLALVKRIVEASGGSVRYEHAPGARFVLSFPKGAS